MSNHSKSNVVAVGGIILIGLIGLALTMFVLLRDETPDPEPSEDQPAAQVDVDQLEPITVSTNDREVRWMFIDPERGLSAAQRPLDIPRNVRALVVVWKSDFPPADVYYVIDLSDVDLLDAEVTAVPLSPAVFEARSREVVTALWLAYDAIYLAEDMALESVARDIRGKAKSQKKPRRERRRKTVIERINKYPSFRVPGR